MNVAMVKLASTKRKRTPQHGGTAGQMVTASHGHLNMQTQDKEEEETPFIITHHRVSKIQVAHGGSDGRQASIRPSQVEVNTNHGYSKRLSGIIFILLILMDPKSNCLQRKLSVH